MLHIYLLFFLFAISRTVQGEVDIRLSNLQHHTATYKNYSHTVFYDSGFSREVFKSGFLHGPDLSVCQGTLPPTPNSSNSSWFAIVDISNCFGESIEKLKEAGYVLAIVSNTIKFATNRKHNFTIVTVPQSYIEYLVGHALSNFTEPETLATIAANNALFVFGLEVGLYLLSLVALCVLALCLGLKIKWNQDLMDFCPCSCWKKYYRKSYSEYQTVPNIMRPLNSLKFENPNKLPRKLPTKARIRESTLEYCIICDEELRSEDRVKILPCGHNNGHVKCMDRWLEKNKTCPICRCQVNYNQS